jgi:hypothetical protein
MLAMVPGMSGEWRCKGRGTGGWQEPGAEELDFSLRVRRHSQKRIVYNPSIKVRHRVYRYRFTTRFIARRAYWEGYAKSMVRRWYQGKSGEEVLSVEYGLLRRIIFHLLPITFLRLLSRPATALRQLYVTFLVLASVAAGYLNSEISILLHRSEYYAAPD